MPDLGGIGKILMSRCRAMMESSPEGDKPKMEAGSNYNKNKLKHNRCTTERDFTNLAEPLHGGEDHQHDIETASVMTTAIDKPAQVDRARSCMTSNSRFRDEHNLQR